MELKKILSFAFILFLCTCSFAQVTTVGVARDNVSKEYFRPMTLYFTDGTVKSDMVNWQSSRVAYTSWIHFLKERSKDTTSSKWKN